MKKRMETRKPDYTRLLKTIRLEEPDAVPIAELGIDRLIKEAFLGRPIRTLQEEVAFWYEAGYDYIYQRPNYEYPGMPPNVAAGTRIQFEAQTGEKEAESIDMMAQGGQIMCLKDVESFDWPDPDTIDYAPLAELADLLPEGMGLITGVGGIFTRVWMLMGFERMSLAAYDQPELLKAVFEQVGQIQCEVLRRIVDKPRVFAIWYGDDLAYTEGLMVSPELLRGHLFPWLEEISSITHEAGMPLIMHSDGKLHEVIDDLIALGLNALHPIEPKAMDIRHLKKRHGDKLALFGNVDMEYTLCRGTPDEVRQEVCALIRDLAPGGGYAVGSSCSVSDYVPLANFNAMREATFEFGRYPIDC